MKKLFGRLAGTLLALTLTTGLPQRKARSRSRSAAAPACAICRPCWRNSSANTKRRGWPSNWSTSRAVRTLKAVLGGSADVVSGYFDHCVNLAAKKQELQSFVIYDRYPGLVLVVSPAHTNEIKSIKDLAGKKVGVSAPGSSTDFFLKYLLKKNGLDPTSAAVIGVGLGATAVAAMQQGQIDAAVMLDPSVSVLQGSYPDLKILADTRTEKDTLAVTSAGNIRVVRFTRPRRGSSRTRRKCRRSPRRSSTRSPGFTRTRRKRSWGRCPMKSSARTRSSISPR